MREILFRGKDTKTGEWVLGLLFSRMNTERVPIGTYIIEDAYEQIRYGRIALESHRPDYHTVLIDTVGQYTGLKDKNGKKIFEGDIVRINSCSELAYVTMEEFRWLCIMPTLQHWRHPLERNFSKYEVVGNLTDNPELLEESHGA